MSTLTTATPTTSSGGERALARVKWFNSKSGFGFVTVTDGPHNGRDIFVHHSAIGVLSQQYKYLVQGEYIELFILPIESGEHEYQAANVCGVNGGKLMCETRNESRLSRTSENWKTVAKTAKPVIVASAGAGAGRGAGRGGAGRGGAGRGAAGRGRGRGAGGKGTAEGRTNPK